MSLICHTTSYPASKQHISSARLNLKEDTVTQTRHDTNSASSLSDTTAAPTDPQWSVVVIARNEEGSIATCLESVLHAFAARSYELIFVDSASTDDTVLIASRFPAKVIRIPPT